MNPQVINFRAISKPLPPTVQMPALWEKRNTTFATRSPPLDPCIHFARVQMELVGCALVLEESGAFIDLE